MVDKVLQKKISEFRQKIYSLYPEEVESIIDFHENYKIFKSFRITDRDTEQSILKSLYDQKLKLENVFHSFYITIDKDSSNNLTSVKEFTDNKIYIQELSSGIPVYLAYKLLGNDKSLTILDICAAPGSKTTQLVETFSQSDVYANESNKKRFYTLQKILKDFDYKVNLMNFPAQKIPYAKKQFLDSFDLIICDVPCSNEGSLNLNSIESLKYWSEKEPNKISKIQKGILNAALKLLKKGGVLVYSTCTYSVEENESVVNWLIKKHSNVKIVDINTDIKNLNYKQGFTTYKNKSFDKSLLNTIRILPKNGFKAFYVALLIKL